MILDDSWRQELPRVAAAAATIIHHPSSIIHHHHGVRDSETEHGTDRHGTVGTMDRFSHKVDCFERPRLALLSGGGAGFSVPTTTTAPRIRIEASSQLYAGFNLCINLSVLINIFFKYILLT